jgi:hypothetical protein
MVKRQQRAADIALTNEGHYSHALITAPKRTIAPWKN